MRRRYFLPLPIMVCFLLISLLLQSCGGSTNLPIEEVNEHEGEQGRRKRARIEIREEQQQNLIRPTAKEVK
ncbi:hypothetical protein [Candidatus Amoebophilus asiaticus]|nr:hypothetical protein [Candidatus Amoebophilus asiaticus]